SLELFGFTPSRGDADPRPVPDENQAALALSEIFDALVSTLADTSLEPDLPDLLWSTVHVFHRAADRAQRDLDVNEDAQRRSQDEQDGSEIRSVELEALIEKGIGLVERRDAYEAFRDRAADLFETHTGS